MFKKTYWQQRREAGIWMLSKLVVPNKMKVTAYIDKNQNREDIYFEKSYDKYTINDLAEEKVYNKEILYEVAYFLYGKGHINVWQQRNDIYASTIQAKPEGEIALKEDIYGEEIRNYNSDKIYRRTRWLIPVFAFIISIVSLCISMCRKSVVKLQLEQLPELTTKQKESDTLKFQNTNPLIDTGKIKKTVSPQIIFLIFLRILN
jgi:hypothetical protein